MNYKEKISLPDYTRGEEIFNMVSHIFGGALSVAALVLCVIFAALKGDAWSVVSASIYGATQVVLYTMSSIYHGLVPENPKKIFRIIDHCTIYFLIAGTYTPIALCTIRRFSTLYAWIVFGVIWGACALGVTFTAIDLNKYKIFSMICYLAMGWCIVFLFDEVTREMGKGGTVFLLLGGILYTIGAAVYIIGKKVKVRYVHSVFHLFVVFAGIMHFFMILFFVLPI